MTRIAATVSAVVTFACIASMFPEESLAADVPADRVVVMYFHRTKRCPTCLKMGTYTEEAVKNGFPEQLKDGTVELHYVDFQDKRNAALAKGYKVTGPALIVAKIADNKVATSCRDRLNGLATSYVTR